MIPRYCAEHFLGSCCPSDSSYPPAMHFDKQHCTSDGNVLENRVTVEIRSVAPRKIIDVEGVRNIYIYMTQVVA